MSAHGENVEMHEQSIERVRFHHEEEFPMGLLERSARSEHTVAELLPPGFARYLRIFHPFYPASVSDPNREPNPATRTWQSLADEAGAVFHPEIVWNSLRPALRVSDQRVAILPWWADEGSLSEPARSALYAVLASHSRDTEAYFLYYLASIVRGKGPLLFRADIRRVREVQATAEADLGYSPVPSPEFVWPSDRAWVLNTDYDLQSTYVACGEELAGAILNDPELETLEVTLQTRVDSAGDRINRPHERH